MINNINFLTQKDTSIVYRRARILAYLTDIYFVGIVTSILFFILNLPKYNSTILFNSSIGYLVFFIYCVSFECSNYRATPGKMIFKLKIGNLEDKFNLQVLIKILIRNFLKIFSIGLVGIGLVKNFTKRGHNTFHDNGANTLLISLCKSKSEFKVKLYFLITFHFFRVLIMSGFSQFDYNFQDKTFLNKQNECFTIYDINNSIFVQDKVCNETLRDNIKNHKVFFYQNKIFSNNTIDIMGNCKDAFQIFSQYGYVIEDELPNFYFFYKQSKKEKIKIALKNQLVIIPAELLLNITQYFSLFNEVHSMINLTNTNDNVFRNDIIYFVEQNLNKVFYDYELVSKNGFELLLYDVFWYRTILPSFRNLLAIHVCDYSKLILTLNQA